MAHNITFYCFSGGIRPLDALARLIEECSSTERTLFASGESSGGGWAATSLRTTQAQSASGATLIEFHSGTDIVRDSVAQVVDSDVSGRVGDADAMLIVTLTGDAVDTTVLRVVWRSVTRLWNAIPFDDVSGFEVGEASIG